MSEPAPAEPPPPSVALPAPPPEPPGVALRFTGTGSEYFRIWVVNTLLTLLTLGVYSAWAKVRKVAYFARNTQLLGDSFEFVADPWAILRGRVVALLLFGFYSFAFHFSLTAGLVAVSVLLALAPALFASAMRFRLQNTRWRAIRFGFHATPRDAYGSILVVVAIWVSGTVAGALGGEISLAVAGVVALLLLPWMHHRVKAFQHRNAGFAGLRSHFDPTLGRFYATYLIALLLLFGAGVVMALVAGALVAAAGLAGAAPGAGAVVVGLVVGVLTSLAIYTTVVPYFATRIQRAVWEHTRLGPHGFATTIAFSTMWPVIAKNALLLAVTAGLYWPFATVAWARYRVEAMRLVPAGSVDDAVAGLDAGPQRRAVGEGAFEFFGIDLGW